MTNEEKATKLVEQYETRYNDTRDLLWTDLEDIAIQMAEWKEKQIIDKACEWLENNLASFWQCKFYNEVAFIDDFKKAMKGGEE